MPMGTPTAMTMTPPPGARPPLGPGGTPVGKGEILHIKYDEESHSSVSWQWELVSCVLSPKEYYKSSLCLSWANHKSKATGINSESSCLWLSCFRRLRVSLSDVALPTEPVPLSAPGGPPERSALSASVLQGAIPRTPCSPIPGVGRLESLRVHLGINASFCKKKRNIGCCWFLHFEVGFCNTL